MKLHSITVLSTYHLINMPLGHLLYTQMELGSMQRGVGQIMFVEIVSLQQCTLMVLTLSDLERTGSKMVMPQGILTLWLSTADTPCQPHVSAYGHW